MKGGDVKFSTGAVEVLFEGAELTRSPYWARQAQSGNQKKGVPPVPQSMMWGLVHTAFAVRAGEPVLLLGDSCYKTLVVGTWAQVTGRSNELLTEHFTDGRCGKWMMLLCLYHMLH